MKRRSMRWFSAVLALLFLSGCAGTAPQTGDETVPMEITQLTEVDPIPVRELPLYEDIPLEENEIITILDIGESGILLTVSLDDLEQGWYRTSRLLLYEPEQRLVTELESFADGEEIMIASGCLVDDGYVYAMLHCELRLIEQNGVTDAVGEGVIRRRGDAAWEIPFSSDCPNDLEGLPMLLALPDGDVVFALCGGQPDDPAGGGNYRVTVVSLEGEKRVVFAPEDVEPAAYSTMLIPDGGGYLFRVRTEDGHCFYRGDGDGAERVTAVDCRAIYPWWVTMDGQLLFTAGYQDDEGMNYEKNVLLTEEGALIQLEGLRLTRFTVGGSGRIAAVDTGWQPYLLAAGEGTLEAVRIDLPAVPTDFYRGDDGRLYVHQDTPRMGPVGLYEILEQGGD